MVDERGDVAAELAKRAGSNGQRTQAWLDSLDNDERDVALRALDFPGGSMAVAYASVELYRQRLEMRMGFSDLRAEIADLQRPWWRQAAPNVGAFIGGMVAAFLGGLRAW